VRWVGGGGGSAGRCVDKEESRTLWTVGRAGMWRHQWKTVGCLHLTHQMPTWHWRAGAMQNSTVLSVPTCCNLRQLDQGAVAGSKNLRPCQCVKVPRSALGTPAWPPPDPIQSPSSHHRDALFLSTSRSLALVAAAAIWARVLAIGRSNILCFLSTPRGPFDPSKSLSSRAMIFSPARPSLTVARDRTVMHATNRFFLTRSLRNWHLWHVSPDVLRTA
jgi:hypothetical protein